MRALKYRGLNLLLGVVLALVGGPGVRADDTEIFVTQSGAGNVRSAQHPVRARHLWQYERGRRHPGAVQPGDRLHGWLQPDPRLLARWRRQPAQVQHQQLVQRLADEV